MTIIPVVGFHEELVPLLYGLLCSVVEFGPVVVLVLTEFPSKTTDPRMKLRL
jgi:hypothetical protein